MSTKILNLDKLIDTQPKRELVIGGKTHLINDMTVRNFAITTERAKAIAAEDLHVQLEETVQLIARSVPTVDVEMLRDMSLQNLNVIAAFVRGEDVEGAEVVEGDKDGEEGTPAGN